MNAALAVVVGKFEALHIGHRALTEAAADLGTPCLVQFSGMAETLGWKGRPPQVAPRDRRRVLDAWAARIGRPVRSLSLPFERLRDLDPEAFVVLLARDLAASAVVVGQDFRFGRERMGDCAVLAALGRRHGLEVRVIAGVVVDGVLVSSSLVRQHIEDGHVEMVIPLLERRYRLCGTVVPGDHRGRAMGFPTANCGDLENLPPADGVYAAWAQLDGGPPLAAAVNIGHAPTVAEDREMRVEAFLIDWAGDCYGRCLDLDFVARLRPELRFADRSALVAQLRRDVDAVRAILADAGPAL